MTLTPIRTTSTPEKKVDSKVLANIAFEFVNHETHIFARDRKTKHPSREVGDIEIVGFATNGGL